LQSDVVDIISIFERFARLTDHRVSSGDGILNRKRSESSDARTFRCVRYRTKRQAASIGGTLKKVGVVIILDGHGNDSAENGYLL
jgi:hypothetical protein